MLRVWTVVIVVAAATPGRAGVCDGYEATPQRDRDRATTSRVAGDEQFIAYRYPDAIARYREAFAIWPHPKIALAIGLALLKLERWVDAADELERILPCTAALVEDAAKAKEYFALAVAKTGIVAIASKQKGATLELDGKQVLVAPGTARVRVSPGGHVVVARVGAHSADAAVDVSAGGETLAEPVVYVTGSEWRYARWKPWLVIGTGAVVAGIGGGLLYSKSNLEADYHAAVRREAEACMAPPCPLSSATLELKDRANLRGALAIGGFVAGGAIAGLGVVLLAIDRVVETRRVAITPWHDGHGVWVMASF